MTKWNLMIGAGCAAVAISFCTLWTGDALSGTVTLTNEDTVTGTITSQTDDGVTIEHPDLGVLNIPAASVAGVTLEETDPIYVEPPTPDFFWGWAKTFEAGLNGSDGNSDTINFYARFTTGYEDKNHRWAIDANYFRGEDDGETTRDEGTLGALKDWLEPEEDYFYFAQARYEYDRFTDYESRATGAVGVGYQFIDDGEYSLLGRAGLGGNYEFGDVNDFIPELVFGIEFGWEIKEGHTFSAYNTIFPAIDPFFGEFRNNSGVAYTLKIDSTNGLSFRAGAENEFNSEVEPGTEENDLKYYAGIVYEF